MELLSTLGINWQLMLAQVVNFGIVFVALAVFVYKPLLKLIDERREKIRTSLADVEAISRQKKEFDALHAEQLRKIDTEGAALLARTKADAEKLKAELLTSAQAEAETVLARGRQALQEERSRVLTELQGSLADIIIKLTEKMLKREVKESDHNSLMAELEKTLTSAK